MIVNNLGYIFECRTDCNNDKGVIETIKSVIQRGDNKHITLTCTIDNTGKVVMPAYNNLSLGFKPLIDICQNESELDKFLRSNKPFFGKIGSFAMIASGTIVVNSVTGELVSDKDFGFYIPKLFSNSIEDFKDKKGYIQPALVCDKLSTENGFNLFKVNEIMYKAYLNSFIKSINMVAVINRGSFLSQLLFVRCDSVC